MLRPVSTNFVVWPTNSPLSDLRAGTFAVKRLELIDFDSNSIRQAMKPGRWITRVGLTRSFPFISSAQPFFERGLRAVDFGDWDQAVTAFKRATLIKPQWYEPYRWLGEVHIANQQPAQAIGYFQKALGLNPDDEESCSGYMVALLLNGNHDQVGRILGVLPGTLPTILHARSNDSVAAQRVDVTPFGTCAAAIDWRRFWRSAEHASLQIVRRLEGYGRSLYYDGKSNEARTVWAGCIDWRTNLWSKTNPGINQRHYLSPEWLFSIGHLALIDFYLKLMQLGRVRSEPPILLLSASEKIGNPALLAYWAPFLQVVTDPAEIQMHLPNAAISEISMNALRLADGRTLLQYQEAAPEAHRAWEAEGRTPLLRLEETHRKQGWATLNRLGVPSGSWFVSIHVRSGFYNHGCDPVRNADIASYHAAFEAITQRGGWVVRIGDNSMQPLPPLHQVVDYAHSEFKSDWMDMFLMSECRFFIATSSGPAMVPPIFGVPCVYTNWLPLNHTPCLQNNLCIHKLYRINATQRYLTYTEMFQLPLRRSTSPTFLSQAGISIIDNTPEELKDVVVEMLDNLARDAHDARDNTGGPKQDQVAHMGTQFRGYAGPRIGRAFLEKHAQLLDEPAAALKVVG